MTHPRDAKGRFVRRTAPAPLPPHVIFPVRRAVPPVSWPLQRPPAPAVERRTPTSILIAALDGRELGKSRTRTGVNPQAKPLRAYGACSDHLSRITPRRRSLSGRTK